MRQLYLSSLTAVLFTALSFVAFSQTSVVAKIKPSNVYAGIEVGSKGVKMSIIEMGPNAAASGRFTTLADTSSNTDFISFTKISFDATLNALAGFYDVAGKRFNVTPDHVFTVVSSGVKGQALKEGKQSWVDSLAKAFRAVIKEPGLKFAAIDAAEEARLSHLGIIPESRRFNTFLIDIGSGNTKGGYFRNGNTKEIKLFTLTWGTKTVANETEKRLDDNKTIPNYSRQLMRVLAGEPETEIVYAVNESGAYNMNDNFAFSGGIAWSVATLMFPELIENSVVPFTYRELKEFNAKVRDYYSLLSPAAITGAIEDRSVDKNAVAKEVARVHKVFDQKALLAGSGLLMSIVKQFDGTWEEKKFFLVKNGQVGWISAYVNESVNR